MRIALVAENVSVEMSGEASLAYQFLRFMTKRNVDVWIVCHERVRHELEKLFTESQFAQVRFIQETLLQTWIWRLSQRLPYRMKDLLTNQLLHLLTQIRARRVVRQLVREQSIDVVFEPAPISPKGVSCMYDVGAPVVIGPMCGGLDFPPAFRFMDSRFSRFAVQAGRYLSQLAHRLFPGKLRADALIVANCVTKKALPTGCRGNVYEVYECGVDLSDRESLTRADHLPEAPVRFVFVGRFVDWKGVKYLVEAFRQIPPSVNAVLELVGHGELFPEIEKLVDTPELRDRVRLRGWLPWNQLRDFLRQCDVMVHPSLRECGGTVLLEAMALGMPIITTRWAGPAEYINETCGILVAPTSPEAFTNGLSEAISRLADSPQLREELGRAGHERVHHHYFDWESKTDRIIQILAKATQRGEEKSVRCPVLKTVNLTQVST